MNLEEIKKLYKIKYYFFLFIYFDIFINIIFYYGYSCFVKNNSSYENIFYMLLTIINIFFFTILYYFNNVFQKKINEIFIKTAKENGAEFFPNKYIDKKYYLMIENGHYNKYTGKYYTRGKDFEFSFVKTLKKEKRRENDGTYETKYKTVYQGTIYKTGFYIVSEKRYELKYSRTDFEDYIPFLINKRKIKLDNLEFEKYFDVYGDDQIEGRLIFNHFFMQQILSLYKLKGPFNMVIQNGICVLSFKNNTPVSINILNFSKDRLFKAVESYKNYFLIKKILTKK